MEFPLGVFLFLGGTESGCPFFKNNPAAGKSEREVGVGRMP